MVRGRARVRLGVGVRVRVAPLARDVAELGDVESIAAAAAVALGERT